MLINPLLSFTLGVLFLLLLAWLFWPQRGLFWRWQERSRLTDRVLIEDALKHIYVCENQGRVPTVESLAGALSISMDKASTILEIAQVRGLISLQGERFQLTEAGRETAVQVVRAHRMWEKYLAEFSGFGEEEWHAHAERLEHNLSSEEVDRMSARLGHPTHDPHGDPIPTAAGNLVGHGGVALPELEGSELARIVHIEDEPGMVYAQIVAEKLHPGMTIKVDQISSDRVQLWSEEGGHILAPIVARNIYVIPLEPSDEEEAREGVPLSSLQAGTEARVLSISNRIRGRERRRLFDLGLIPGTEITVEMISPGGDPTAYRIRGSVIALRESQTRLIRVEEVEQPVSEKDSVQR